MAPLRALLPRLILFPWLIWDGVALLPRHLRERMYPGSAAAHAASWGLQTFLYLGLGLPLTVVALGELAISLHQAFLPEQSTFRLQSDFETAAAADAVPRFEVPGPRTPASAPIAPGPTEAYRRHLAERYAPVVYQKLSSQPQWDIPLLVDFDGNADPRDNIDNEVASRPHVAGIHGELTAETPDSYYFTYSLYHVKDYDHPVREYMSEWTYHDNDNEGLHIRVDKASLAVVEAETWFHNRFLLFNDTGVSRGSEPVHGRIHVEDGPRVIVYAQPQGHGVRLAQLVDLPDLERGVKVLRLRGDRPAVAARADDSVQVDVTYELEGFDAWYAAAQGPFGRDGVGDSLFEEVIPLGRNPDGSRRVIGRFIAGRQFKINSWVRPKPMWSWDDGWDEIPIFVWHFFPSISFESHGGTPLSHDYLYNRPCEKVFGETAEEVYASLDLAVERRPGDKWGKLAERGGHLPHTTYWRAAQIWIKEYVNYLFHALG